MDRKNRQLRCAATQFTTRDESDGPHISGYFVVFGDVYDIAPGMSESVAPGAFDRTLSGDIRALVNHDPTLILGRNKAGTLKLSPDAHGLWGDIVINTSDSDAINAYERVKRGDIDQASFGFDILTQETEIRPDGSVHWTITDVDLHEVSICTFPAYEATNISARAAEREDLKTRSLSAWKERMKGVLNHGTEGTAAEEAN